MFVLPRLSVSSDSFLPPFFLPFHASLFPPLSLCFLLQVWNVNAYCAVVAVFNIQGSSFNRRLRRFHTHDAAPPPLTAAVSSADVPLLAQQGAQGGCADEETGMCAAYVDSTQVERGGRGWLGRFCVPPANRGYALVEAWEGVHAQHQLAAPTRSNKQDTTVLLCHTHSAVG